MSVISGSVAAGSQSPSKLTRGSNKTQIREKWLRSFEYSTLLRIIRDNEDQMHLYCEVFDKMAELSKQSRKVEVDFLEVLRKAEADRKYKKYIET